MLPEGHHGLLPGSMVLPEGQYSGPFFPSKFRPHPQDEPKPPWHDHCQDKRSHLGLHMSVQQQTNPVIWFTAVFCAILWLVITIGGLIVLIIYLIYSPKSPCFDISAATLNAAYLGTGYLLNSDTTLLVNFSNPNHKTSVDFSYNIVNLYYGETLISTTYIEPFSGDKEESKFASIHMVSSRFRCKRLFRALSNFGGLLRYSYWLYSHCRLEFSGSPSGVLVSSKCRTKR